MIDATRGQPITVQAIAQQSPEAATMRTGDIINQTGNFSGSNINLKSRLDQVTQAIGARLGADADTAAELRRLITELEAQLGTLPPEQATDAEAVATLTGELIDKAAAEPRNPVVLKASADALLTTAGRLAERCKPVLNLVDQIVRLLGLG